MSRRTSSRPRQVILGFTESLTLSFLLLFYSTLQTGIMQGDFLVSKITFVICPPSVISATGMGA